ncbi:hypothetical protein [Pseudomonas sp. 18175]|uniref:hypothetical protein n=1 Tax=Pseudomonas sp. 18175 TaxID=3390056 RepID=UPI003D1DE493
MINLFILILCCFSMFALAEGRIYSLDSNDHGWSSAEFTWEGEGAGERTIKGYLRSKDGVRYGLPDECEPEGGNAELVDAYMVRGKKEYFLFVCAWSVQHPGIGINGTQYEFFVYRGENLGRVVKDMDLSSSLSAYEGSLEGGGISHAWYTVRRISISKLLELEAGNLVDSLALAHEIVQGRLKDNDIQAIRNYLTSERVYQLFRDAPINNHTAAIYNDLGYALWVAGNDFMSYEILMKVEAVDPNRIVLKLNIADVLWSIDRGASRDYYEKYVDLMRGEGKETLIPTRVSERLVAQ